MSLTENGSMSPADVAAVMGANNGGFGGWGSDLWLILILLFAFGGYGGGFGGFGGFGAWGMDGLYPWMNQADITQSGFNQAATNTALSGIQSSITSGFGDVQLGIAGVNQNLCQTGAGITAAVNNGFAQAEIANNGRQMANMNQAFAAQTAMAQGFNGLQSQLAQCCCDNRLATAQTQALVQSENCADRAALSEGLRDIIANQVAGFQSIKDQLCNDKIDAKNEKIAELQQQVLMRDLAASQAAQTTALVADNTAQTQYIVNRVAPYPIPSYNVPSPYGYGYGYVNGCGCGMA